MKDYHGIEVDEPVELLAYDQTWIEDFRQESERLKRKLRDEVIAIEHIGSTAIPDLQSKPIIDVMVGVATTSLRTEVIAPLLDEYESLGEAGVAGRLYFRKRGKTAVNAHVVEHLGTIWNDNILLREYLLANPREARRYGQFKARVMAEGKQTLLTYSQAKRPIIEQLLEDARTWRSQAPTEKRDETCG